MSLLLATALNHSNVVTTCNSTSPQQRSSTCNSTSPQHAAWFLLATALHHIVTTCNSTSQKQRICYLQQLPQHQYTCSFWHKSEYTIFSFVTAFTVQLSCEVLSFLASLEITTKKRAFTWFYICTITYQKNYAFVILSLFLHVAVSENNYFSTLCGTLKCDEVYSSSK